MQESSWTLALYFYKFISLLYYAGYLSFIKKTRVSAALMEVIIIASQFPSLRWT